MYFLTFKKLSYDLQSASSINICFTPFLSLNSKQKSKYEKKQSTYLETHTYHLDSHDQASPCTVDARLDVPFYWADDVAGSDW